MNPFFKLIIFFIKVLLGICVSLVIFAEFDIRWWQDEGIIIPILLFVDAVASFYFAYRLAMKFNFPLGIFSIVPVAYGVLLPLAAVCVSMAIDTPFVLAILNSLFQNSGGITFFVEAIIVLCLASVIALTLTCMFTWSFIKMIQRLQNDIPKSK